MPELIELQKSDEDMDGVQFVLRAMYEKPDPLSTMCHHHCVKIEDHKMIGTNGKQVHAFDYTGLYVPGVYRVLKRLKTHVVMIKEDEADYKKPFPPYQELLSHPTIDVEFQKHFPNSEHAIAEGATMVIRALKSYETISPAKLMALDDIFNCKICHASKFVLFEGIQKTACIMKMSFED